MKTVLLLFLFLTVAFNVFSQKMYEVQFSDCPLKFTLEDTELYIYYETGDSIMVRDFMYDWDDKQIEKVKGYIMLQVMVDTVNQVCCISYTNKTNISDKKLDVQNKLMQMSGWKRFENVLPDENLCAMFTLIFDKKEITLIRTGYNRNTGRTILQNTVYRKFFEPPIIDSLPESNTLTPN